MPEPSRSGPQGATTPPHPVLIRLADVDNVVIAATDLDRGTYETADGERIQVVEPVALGHKVAARAIADREQVVRAGMPIGSATSSIEPGSWVHTHNLRSDYLPTFARRGGVA